MKTRRGDVGLEILREHAESVAAYLRKLLAGYKDAPAKLREAITYSLMAGGKRLRPALVLETFAACGGPGSARPNALAAAAAIELIHTFSLVHDDLPAMDDDDFRRGLPTNHKVFGEAMAILAGDAMVTMAFELLANELAGKLVGPMVNELAAASGPEGMIGGQVIDMFGDDKPDTEKQRSGETGRRTQRSSLSIQHSLLYRLHSKKTGALIRASCRMGAIAAGASAKKLAAVSKYGECLGLAFQIVDDLLDVTASKEQLGKATGKDETKGKKTFPSLLGVEGSRKEANRLLDAAIRSCDVLPKSSQGLIVLANFVVRRDR